MSFLCLQFPPKNERKLVNLRFHNSKVEFVRLFFGGNIVLKKSFQFFLTFKGQLILKCPFGVIVLTKKEV
jgi:hypothetical protein